MVPRDARCWDHCRVPHAPNPRPCVGLATTALSPLPLREGRHCPHHSPWNELSVTRSDSVVWAAKPGSPPTSCCQEEEGKALWGLEDGGGLCLLYCGGKPQTWGNVQMAAAKNTAPLLTASFILTKKWEPPKCPSVDECIHNMQCIHTVECHSAMKKNQGQATTWADLENIIKGT